MIFDYAGQINDFAEDVTLTRASGGFESFGVYTPGPTTDTTIRAVVIHGDQTQDLMPAGERTSGMVTIYTSAPLRTTSAPEGARADRITYEGQVYEVRAVRAWVAQGNYFEAVATQVGQ